MLTWVSVFIYLGYRWSGGLTLLTLVQVVLFPLLKLLFSLVESGGKQEEHFNTFKLPKGKEIRVF